MNKVVKQKVLFTFILATLLFSPLLWIFYSIDMTDKTEDKKKYYLVLDIREKSTSLLKYLLRSYGDFDNDYDNLSEAQQRMLQAIINLPNEFSKESSSLKRQSNKLKEYFVETLLWVDRYKVEHARKVNALRYLTKAYRQLQVIDGTSKQVINQKLMTCVEEVMLLVMNLSIFQDQSFYVQVEHKITALKTKITLLDPSVQTRFIIFTKNIDVLLNHSKKINNILELLMQEDYSVLLDSMNQQLDNKYQKLNQEHKETLEQKLAYYALWLLLVFTFLLYSRYKMVMQTLKHKEISELDSLTQLMNRRGVIKYFKESLNMPTPTGFVMFIDLDGFKSVNDNLGHHVGDKVLRTIAKRLTLQVNENKDSDFKHCVARLGGDEFIILVTEANIDNVHQVAKELSTRTLELCSKGIGAGLNEYVISASIGIAFFPENSCDLDELLHFADKAMYLSKKQGKNCCNYYQ